MQRGGRNRQKENEYYSVISRGLLAFSDGIGYAICYRKCVLRGQCFAWAGMLLQSVGRRIQAMYDKLTESDIEKIKKEIEHRKLTVRVDAIQAVKEARAQGDLSENFEYYAAKREKNSNESRIRYLENMVKTAQIIESDSEEDEVGMNNTVVLFNEKTQKDMTIRIVTTIRAKPLKGLISIDSPLGRAVYRHKVGERREVTLDNGETYYVVIRSIENTVDDSADTISQY